MVNGARTATRYIGAKAKCFWKRERLGTRSYTPKHRQAECRNREISTETKKISHKQPF
jgi:hypothetical protein